MIDLSVDIAGIKMQNPIMPASGTFGYGEEMEKFIDVSKLGAVVTKGTTLEPRHGNEQPRICETQAGIINFIGLQNPGVREVVESKIPFLRKFEVPIIVNISGGSVEEYVKIAVILRDVPGVAGLEVNISCPNVKHGGVAFGQDPKQAGKIVGALRNCTTLPLIVKLTPNVTNIVAIGEAVVEAGADALSLVNTFKARARIRLGPNKGKWIEGGLSGPCIMPIALKQVSDLAKADLGVPIIGIGGISCLGDALDFFESGADAVQIGTANFLDPTIMIQIIDGLRIYIGKRGFASFQKYLQKNRT
ncbi:dihydroorotate dehydrogenase [Patescibacteria group bacterium]|nr:dihydroorotate dehydrogenase [Patescibacteria group bacterium]